MNKTVNILAKTLLLFVFLVCLTMAVTLRLEEKSLTTNLNDAEYSQEIFCLNVGEKQEVTIVTEKETRTYNGSNRSYPIDGKDCNIDNFNTVYRVHGVDKWLDYVPINVGIYDVKITREEDATYKAFEVTIDSGLEITPKEIELTWNAPTNLEYDGNAKILNCQATSLIDGDECNVDIVLTENSDNVNVTADGFSFVAVSVDNDNYKLPTIKESEKFFIASKEIELTWNAPTNLEYDGNAKILNCQATSLIDGDECNVDIALTENDDNVNVTADGFSFVAVSVDNDNYKLPTIKESEMFVIQPKHVIVEIVDVESGCVYDGAEKSTTATHNELVGDDELSYELSYSKGEESHPINAGEWSVSIAFANISKGTATNYEIHVNDIGALKIEQKVVVVTINDVFEDTLGYVYDGTAKSVSVNVDGLVGEDKLKANLTYSINSQAIEPINVGEWLVSIGSVEMLSGKIENYAVNFEDKGVMVITPKEIELTWNAPTSLEYDGSAKIPNCQATGLIGGDECEVEIALTENRDNVNVTDSGFTFVALSVNNCNYKLPNNTISQTFYLKKKQLSVTADDFELTYGDAVPVYTLKYSGFVDGDDENSLDKKPTASSRYQNNTAVINSKMTINVSGGRDDNYNFVYNNGTITIKKRKITIIANDVSSVVNEKLSPLTYTHGEVVNGDTFFGSLSTDANESTAGEYTISLGTLTINDNYEIEFFQGKYIVKTLNVTTKISSDVAVFVVSSTGFAPDSHLEVETKKKQEIEWLKLSEHEEVLTCYKIWVDNDSVTEGQKTIKLSAPHGARDIKKIKVLTYIDGKQVEIIPRMDGDNISFTTTELGEFVIIQTKTDYRGLYTAMIIIACIFAGFFLWYLIKRRYDFGKIID